MDFFNFSKQKFGENQNKTSFSSAVSGSGGAKPEPVKSPTEQSASAKGEKEPFWKTWFSGKDTDDQAADSAAKEPFWKTWFLDQGTNDTVVDSTTGQVIQVDKPSAIGGVTRGGGKRLASKYANVGGMLIEGLGHLNTAIAAKKDKAESNRLEEDNERYRQMLKTGEKLDGTPVTDQERRSFSNQISRNEARMKQLSAYTQAQEQRTMEAAKKFYDTTDGLSQRADTDISRAKEGLGPLGQLAVDAGVEGVQAMGDAGIAALTGGSAAIPAAIREFGGSAQEARQSGASYGQQLGYGAASAALSAGAGKIASKVAAPFHGVFGAGAAERLAGKLVSRFGENTAVQTMNKLSQTAAGRLAAAALGGGGEELVSSVLQTVLQRATYDPDAEFDLGQAIYDAAVQAVLGGVNGVGELDG